MHRQLLPPGLCLGQVCSQTRTFGATIEPTDHRVRGVLCKVFMMAHGPWLEQEVQCESQKGGQ